ncbi:MAG: preprotein translocase subunit SecG [Pirellulales bacterium]
MSWNGLVMVLMILMALFLILLVLIQRGRGGGLAGALGGMGGQSAFGAKAGDVFTKVTMWTAFLWIVLCIISFKVISANSKQTIAGPVRGPDAAGMRGSEQLDDKGSKADGKSDDRGAAGAFPDTGPAAPAEQQPADSPPE